MKVLVPNRAVIDFENNPKLRNAVETYINNINEKELTPKYISTAQLIIELLEREVKNSVTAPAPKPTSNNNDMPPEGFFD